jgi:glucokinase
MGEIGENTLVLAGDIGGTKTDLGLFKMGKTRPIAKVIESFNSKDASSLTEIIDKFFNAHPISINRAYFGIAGPVINGRCKTTNLPWDVSEDQIKRNYKWNEVRLINDLGAMARAVPLLNKQELESLNNVRLRKHQNITLIAPGTGLGVAFLIYQNGEYCYVPSEGGHIDFSPKNENEVNLWRFLHNKYTHVGIERIISGQGLADIYDWLKTSRMYNEPSWLGKMLQLSDPAKVISGAALSSSDQVCEDALGIFISILGTISGNFALTGMTTGGLYLGGGIPPKILPMLKKKIFMKSFTNKGRFKDLLEKIPVRVILNQKTALLGSAYFGLKKHA